MSQCGQRLQIHAIRLPMRSPQFRLLTSLSCSSCLSSKRPVFHSQFGLQMQSQFGFQTQCAVLYSATFLNSIRLLFFFNSLSKFRSTQLSFPSSFGQRFQFHAASSKFKSTNPISKSTSKLNQFGLQVQSQLCLQTQSIRPSIAISTRQCLLFSQNRQIIPQRNFSS